MNAPLHPSDFVGELCIALAHRWEPERLFMALAYTGYLDESGTHEGSEVTINRRARSGGRPLPDSEIVPRGKTGITHFESTPEGLANIRDIALKIATRNRLPNPGAVQASGRQPS
jgi:hypothetical protein